MTKRNNTELCSPEYYAAIAAKPVLDAKEAVAFLHMSRHWLYKAVEKGILPCYKPGGRKLLFDRKDLEAWMRRGKQSTNDEIREEAMRIMQQNDLRRKSK